MCVPKPRPRDAHGPPGEPARSRCLGKLGKPGGTVWDSPGMGRDHPQGLGLMEDSSPTNCLPFRKDTQVSRLLEPSSVHREVANTSQGLEKQEAFTGKENNPSLRDSSEGRAVCSMDFSCAQWDCLTLIPKVARGALRKAQALQLNFLPFPASAVRRSAQEKARNSAVRNA